MFRDTRFIRDGVVLNDMGEESAVAGTSTEFVSESKVSGNQANIPAHVRRELDVEDGDRLRWRFRSDGELVVEAVHRTAGTFAGFEGYEGGPGGDVVRDHDAFGVEPTTGDERDV